MTVAALQVQQAIFKTLANDASLIGQLGGAKIFDHVPERVQPPYVIVGRTAVSDWSTATEGGESIALFLHTWSKSTSRRESYELQERVKQVLLNGVQPLDGHHLVNLRFQFSETRRDRVSMHLHGVMRFRAFTEPAI